MRPFDPRLLRTAPAARRPVAVLAAVGVGQGVATIGLAFAIAHLAVAVVRQDELVVPALVVAALFGVRAVLAWTAERVAAWAGIEVSVALRETLLRHWLTRSADDRPDACAGHPVAAGAGHRPSAQAVCQSTSATGLGEGRARLPLKRCRPAAPQCSRRSFECNRTQQGVKK